MFLPRMKIVHIKTPSAKLQRTSVPVVPPQFAARRQPLPIPINRSTLSGAPVFAYCRIQQSRSERNSESPLLLPSTQRQLSEKSRQILLGFVIALHFIYRKVYHFCAGKSMVISPLFHLTFLPSHSGILPNSKKKIQEDPLRHWKI